MNSSESIADISPALLAAQKKIGSAKKGAENPFYHSKYADLGSVIEACKEPLNENKIMILQPIMGMVLQTILLHESGQWISSETPIVCSVQNDPQKLGSAISYARRYGLQSLLSIPADDDDANGAIPKQAGQGGATISTNIKTTVSVTKCAVCGASGKYHKPGCPNNVKPGVKSIAQEAEEVFNQ